MERRDLMFLIVGIVYFIILILVTASFCLTLECEAPAEDLDDPSYVYETDCGCSLYTIVQVILVFGIPSWLMFLIVSRRVRKKARAKKQ
jgi:heme/copper-type cytochrome/quinol oxidase subunit 2